MSRFQVMVPMGKQVSEKAAPVTLLGVTERNQSASWFPHGVCTPCASVTQLGGHHLPFACRWVLRQECEVCVESKSGLWILEKLVFEGPGHPLR